MQIYLINLAVDLNLYLFLPSYFVITDKQLKEGSRNIESVRNFT